MFILIKKTPYNCKTLNILVFSNKRVYHSQRTSSSLTLSCLFSYCIFMKSNFIPSFSECTWKEPEKRSQDILGSDLWIFIVSQVLRSFTSFLRMSKIICDKCMVVVQVSCNRLRILKTLEHTQNNRRL